MSVRIVAGEIQAKDATTRSIIPSASLPKWPPFVRVAETIATPRRRFPAHGHAGVEVLTYVIEGSGVYQNASDPPHEVSVGSAQLLTASTNSPHVINPGVGQTLRWFAVVTDLPAGAAVGNRLQEFDAQESAPGADRTTTRPLVGPGSPMQSATGLHASVVSFVEEGTSFRKVGHAANAVAYVLSGQGRVDNSPVEMGEAAIVEGSAGIALTGTRGFRVALVKVPRPA